jgi:hypothetical protein
MDEIENREEGGEHKKQALTAKRNKMTYLYQDVEFQGEREHTNTLESQCSYSFPRL